MTDQREAARMAHGHQVDHRHLAGLRPTRQDRPRLRAQRGRSGLGQYDAKQSFPNEVVAAMADMGLFGLRFPGEYGAMGGNYFGLGMELEEVVNVHQSVSITLEAGCR